MLPEIRQSEYLYPVPKFALDRSDVKDFATELLGFHENFADCFQRSESRDNFYRYMAGQFSQLERKSIEPIAFAMKGGKVRAMQRFVSDAPWDDDRIIDNYRSLVLEDFGHPDSALIFDECGFVKKGDDSIGVARQYCGTVGKVENCQVGLFVAYTSKYGYSLVDKRLYIPEHWFSEEYSDRREKCMLPDDIKFRTKPQLAAEMLHDLAREKVLPFKYVLADSIYTSREFVEAAESLVGITYFLQVADNTLCWLQQQLTDEKSFKYRGQGRTKKLLSDKAKKPVSVKTVAKGINDFFWYRRKVSEGTKGPVEYEFTKRRIVFSHKGLSEKTVWLVIRRTLAKEPDYSYYVSNAQLSTKLKTFVWLSGLRWSIEQCFEETKTELGMDQYEVRKFPGWNHHILTCMLAHYFLWHLKIRLGEKSTRYYAIAAQDAAENGVTYA
ncbi:MAG TPA: IS701 family transposase [Nitrospirota bacterium]|nr:IS701 family transposase [Nitrospirota bacterium]